MISGAVGVDVGGTKIAAGVVAFPEGRIHARRVIPTRPERGGEAVLADVAQVVTELAAEARSQLTVEAIGIGVCELVDLAGKVASANCFDWRSLPLHESFSKIAPSVIEADVRAAALGEALFGAGKPFRQFLYVTVGTGISSCLMLDGKPFRGARGATGTIASSPLPSTSEDSDFSMPSLEQFASGPALAARFNRAGGNVHSGEDVLSAARSGSAKAITIMRSAANALGAAIAWLINALDPEAVVIGGGLGLSKGLYGDSLADSIRRHIWSNLNRNLPILTAALGQDAGIIGAAAAACHDLNDQPGDRQ